MMFSVHIPTFVILQTNKYVYEILYKEIDMYFKISDCCEQSE